MGLDFTNGLLRLKRHNRRFWSNALRLLDLRRNGTLAFPNVVGNQVQILLRQGPAIVAFPFFTLQLWSQIDNLRRCLALRALQRSKCLYGLHPASLEIPMNLALLVEG